MMILDEYYRRDSAALQMQRSGSNRIIIKGTAIILCFIFPGVGQIYLGNYKKGFLLYIGFNNDHLSLNVVNFIDWYSIR